MMEWIVDATSRLWCTRLLTSLPLFLQIVDSFSSLSCAFLHRLATLSGSLDLSLEIQIFSLDQVSVLWLIGGILLSTAGQD